MRPIAEALADKLGVWLVLHARAATSRMSRELFFSSEDDSRAHAGDTDEAPVSSDDDEKEMERVSAACLGAVAFGPFWQELACLAAEGVVPVYPVLGFAGNGFHSGSWFGGELAPSSLLGELAGSSFGAGGPNSEKTAGPSFRGGERDFDPELVEGARNLAGLSESGLEPDDLLSGISTPTTSDHTAEKSRLEYILNRSDGDERARKRARSALRQELGGGLQQVEGEPVEPPSKRCRRWHCAFCAAKDTLSGMRSEAVGMRTSSGLDAPTVGRAYEVFGNFA